MTTVHRRQGYKYGYPVLKLGKRCNNVIETRR
jgi:hypothetical protein